MNLHLVFPPPNRKMPLLSLGTYYSLFPPRAPPCPPQAQHIAIQRLAPKKGIPSPCRTASPHWLPSDATSIYTGRMVYTPNAVEDIAAGLEIRLNRRRKEPPARYQVYSLHTWHLQRSTMTVRWRTSQTIAGSLNAQKRRRLVVELKSEWPKCERRIDRTLVTGYWYVTTVHVLVVLRHTEDGFRLFIIRPLARIEKASGDHKHLQLSGSEKEKHPVR